MTHDSGSHLGDDIDDAVDSTVEDVTQSIREKGSELGRKAAARLEDGRAAAADRLKGAARGLHRRADDIAAGGERISAVTHRMADRVDSASRYFQDNDSRDILSDVETIVRRHPTRSLLAVLAVGFIAGRALSRDD